MVHGELYINLQINLDTLHKFMRAIFEGLIIFIILFIFSKSKLIKKLNAFSIFLILYSLSRFFIEFFRQPDLQLGYIFNNFSMGQLLSLPMLILVYFF